MNRFARLLRQRKLRALTERQTSAEQFVFVMTKPLRAGFFGRLRWLFFGLPRGWNGDGIS